MGLETVTDIKDLVATNPTSTDGMSQGDDHLRNLKAAILYTFDGFVGGVQLTVTEAELNLLSGLTAAAAELNVLDGVTAGTVTASKAVVVDASKDLGDFNVLSANYLNARSNSGVAVAKVQSGAANTGSLRFEQWNGVDDYLTRFSLQSVNASDYVDQIHYDTDGSSVLSRIRFDSGDIQVIEGTLSLASGASVNEFSTDDTLAGDSDSAVPTEQAVKAYVDKHVPTASYDDVATPGAVSTSATTLETTSITLKNDGAVLLIGQVTGAQSGAAGSLQVWLTDGSDVQVGRVMTHYIDAGTSVPVQVMAVVTGLTAGANTFKLRAVTSAGAYTPVSAALAAVEVAA